MSTRRPEVKQPDAAAMRAAEAISDLPFVGCGPRRTEQIAALIAAEYAPVVEALAWALEYGSFDVAEDNPLHSQALDGAREALRKVRG